MEENLRAFLEKFAELERRVRKLAAEDRSLRQEVRSLREKLLAAESEADALRESNRRERGARKKARDQLDALIARLEGGKGAEQGLQGGRAASGRGLRSGVEEGVGAELTEAAEGEL